MYDKKSRRMVPTGPPHAPVGVSKQQRANEAVQRCRARAALKASYNGVGDVPPELRLTAIVAEFPGHPAHVGALSLRP